jgi:stearoyl-CoA desaturase (Delta-9 desaturase)
VTTSQKTTQKNTTHINWVNTIFLATLTFFSIIGALLALLYSTVTWPTWVLAGCFFVAAGLGVTAGYHRLFSHKTYTAPWPIQLMFTLLGSATLTGSVIEWSADHRNHHRYTDTKKDPYNIKQGFWYAHIGWILTRDYSKRDLDNVDDLQAIWFLRLQDREWLGLTVSIMTGLLLPMAIASLWGEAMGGLFIAGGLRIIAGHHAVFCINSICHVFGKSNYSKQISARDSWVTALFTLGEGYHNYHHQFPLDYRNGIKWYHFDPSKWLIFAFSKVGLASNLHRIPNYRIIQARVEAHQSELQTQQSHPLLERLQESILQATSMIKQYEKTYAKSKLKEHRLKLTEAKKELAALFSNWKQLCAQSPA